MYSSKPILLTLRCSDFSGLCLLILFCNKGYHYLINSILHVFRMPSNFKDLTFTQVIYSKIFTHLNVLTGCMLRICTYFQDNTLYIHMHAHTQICMLYIHVYNIYMYIYTLYMYVSVCRYVMLVIEILIAKVWTVLQSFFRVSLSIKILTKQVVIKGSAKTGHNTRDVLINS